MMDRARLLAYITGTVDPELLLRNEYLAAENRILKAQLKGRSLLSDAERPRLAEMGHRLGRKRLEDVATAAKPDTILGWYRRLVAPQFDGSKSRRSPGRPRVDHKLEALVVRMAKENRCRYLLHDRDSKFTQSFRLIIESGGLMPVRLPARSPNLNAYAESWVKSVKDASLSKLILFGEASLRRVLREYVAHYYTLRNHQGKGNVLLFPCDFPREACIDDSVACRERLGGLLKGYHREVA
jgi:hypothetical protein